MVAFQTVAQIAQAEIGLQEASNGVTKYGSWYGLADKDWCAMFIAWCGDQAAKRQGPAVPNPFATSNPKGEASTETWRSWFMSKASYTTSYNGMRPGDIAFWNHREGRNVSHVGLVVEVLSDSYITVEGNTYDRTVENLGSRFVLRRTHVKSADAAFRGYGRVLYEGDPAQGTGGAQYPSIDPTLPTYTDPPTKDLIPRRTTPALTRGALTAVTVSGSRMPTDLVERVTKAKLTFSSTERSSLELQIQDDSDATITLSGMFDQTPDQADEGVPISVDFADQSMQVTTVRRTPGRGGPLITITAVSAAIRELNGWQHKGQVSFGVIRPFEWVERMARQVGARSVVQSIGGETTQVVWIRNAGQTTWEAMQLLAKAEGAVLYEHENTIYYGQPTWLASKSPAQWNLEWWAWDRYSPALAGMPSYEISLDESNTDQISFGLISEDRGLIRPGHLLVWDTVLPGIEGLWMVDTVEFDLLESSVVQVTAGRIVDPAPEPPTGKLSDYLTNSSTTGGVTFGDGSGT